MDQYPNLLSPFKVGKFTFKNRIIMAPYFPQNGEDDGHPTECAIAYYEKRARGGAAQLTVGETPVDNEYANRKSSGCLDICRENPSIRHLSMMKELTLCIQQHGAIAAIELSHAGRENSPATIMNGRNPIGPSGYVRPDGVVVEEMDEEMMERVCGNFANAAQKAKDAGFDSVMLHGGHGWLLAQFLSPLSNRRKDKYGGSLENRARFPMAVINRVREQVGGDMLIELRVSGEELIKGGLGVDEVIEFLKPAEDRIDLVHVSAGAYQDPVSTRTFPSIYQPHGCNAYLSERIKKAVKVPVVLVGAITDPELAERLIAEGKTDFVAMVKQLIAEPQYGGKLSGGRRSEITPCIRCYNCMTGLPGLPPNILCSVNPMAVREFREPYIKPLKIPRKVLVAGGGPGGMKAAVTAAENGHNVTLAEKDSMLGGVLKFTEHDNYKEDLKRFKDHLIEGVHSLKINVLLNTTVTPEFIAEFNPDYLITAIGAEQAVPAIPGINGKNVIHVLEAYGNTDKMGKRITIIGGGLAGCETGIYLAEKGKKVTIIEMADMIAPEYIGMHRAALTDKMEGLVICMNGHTCTGIGTGFVNAAGRDGKEIRIETDTVVNATGMKAKADEASRLNSAAKRRRAIGDCVKGRQVREAVHEGFFAAMDI